MTINYTCLGDHVIHFIDPTGKPHMLSINFPGFTKIKTNLLKQKPFESWKHLLRHPEGPVYYAYETRTPENKDTVFVKVLPSSSATEYVYYYLDDLQNFIVNPSDFPPNYRDSSPPSASFSTLEDLQSYYIEYFI